MVEDHLNREQRGAWSLGQFFNFWRRLFFEAQIALKQSPVLAALLFVLLGPTGVQLLAQKPTKEDDYYPIFPLPIPEGVVLESGAVELLPDGRLAASSRRGEIYLISNPLSSQ